MRLVQPPKRQAWPLYHADTGIMFFPIYKNGHSGLCDWFKGLGFDRFIRVTDDGNGYQIPDHTISLVVLREPFGRYISGLAQMSRAGIMPDLRWEDYIDAVERFNRRTSTPWNHKGDLHFAHQTTTFDRMGPQRVLFDLTDLAPMVEWLTAYGIDRAAELEIPHQKRTEDDKIRYAEETLTRRIVEREYADDVELWRQVSP